MALYNNYLLDKKSCPSDVLGGKRLLSDYKGAPSRNKKKPEAADKQGVAIAKGWKRTENIPTCHGCDRKCEDGCHKCHITEDHRSKVAALEEAGHFCANSESEGGTKTTADSGTSELTEDMTIDELLRLTGRLPPTVGMRSTDGEMY